jgi:DNA-binding HxlR family transcriptional regulator
MDADLIRRAPRDRCSVAHALAVLGERWTILVLREAFYGIRRFDEMQRAIGCARNVLADRLATLVEHGVLARVGYRDEGQRERFEYRLTPMGFEAFPVVVALMQWGDRWLPAPGGPPIEVLHRGCGAKVHAELRCERSHGTLTARDTEPRPLGKVAAPKRKAARS